MTYLKFTYCSDYLFNEIQERGWEHPFQVGLAYPSHRANYYNLYTQHPLEYLPSNLLLPGVPNAQPSRVQTDTSCQISGSIRLEIKSAQQM